VLKARRFLSKKYGKIYIRFSKPVSLKQYLAETGGEGQETGAALSYNLARGLSFQCGCFTTAMEARQASIETLVRDLWLLVPAVICLHRSWFRLNRGGGPA